MIESPINCMRCDGVLETGFLLDRSWDGSRPLLWADASHVGTTTGAKADGIHQIEVDAYRCVNCGRVELFAGLGTGEN